MNVVMGPKTAASLKCRGRQKASVHPEEYHLVGSAEGEFESMERAKAALGKLILSDCEFPFFCL